ncbi:MAG: hypothetical protein RIE53_07220 [Rhodothermales bacterium]
MHAPRLAHFVLLIPMILLMLGQSVRMMPAPDATDHGVHADDAMGLTAEPTSVFSGVLPSGPRPASVASDAPQFHSARFAERIVGQYAVGARVPEGPRVASLSRQILRVYRC